MQTVIITISNIGCGKSTWARIQALNDDKIIIVSLDAIREMLNGRYLYREELEPLVMDIALDAAQSALERGLSVIIDDCFVTKAERKRVIDMVEHVNSRHALKVGVEYVCFHALDNIERRIADPRGYDASRWYDVAKQKNDIFESPFDDGFSGVKILRGVYNGLEARLPEDIQVGA